MEMPQQTPALSVCLSLLIINQMNQKQQTTALERLSAKATEVWDGGGVNYDYWPKFV